MVRNSFSFDSWDKLMSMSAAWFLSYRCYNKIDKNF